MGTNGTDLVRASEVAAGQIARRDFGGQQLEQRAETAGMALAARAKAEVEARFLMAMHRPRDIEVFRTRLLKECRRPGFAESAEYERPVGKEKNSAGDWVDKYVTGPSIRLLETAIQNFGNIDAQAPVIYETEEVRVVRAQMVDLETNASWSQDVVIPKRVEKRGKKNKNSGIVDPPPGREVVSQRPNSYGETTFLVVATDSEVSVLQSALISKAQRKNGERLLPADIIHEALDACRKTMADADAQDPDAAKRKVIDAFATLNIGPTDLGTYLGKTLDRLQPADLKELRGLFTAISGGELTWESALEAKEAERGDGGSTVAQAEVLKNKLASLGKTQAKGETGTSSSDQKSKDGDSPGGVAPESSKTDLPKHIIELRAWRDSIGGEAFLQVLGNHGCSTINEVPVETFAAIQEELALKAKDLGKTAPEPKQEPAKRLKFGTPKGGQRSDG